MRTCLIHGTGIFAKLFDTVVGMRVANADCIGHGEIMRWRCNSGRGIVPTGNNVLRWWWVLNSCVISGRYILTFIGSPRTDEKKYSEGVQESAFEVENI